MLIPREILEDLHTIINHLEVNCISLDLMIQMLKAPLFLRVFVGVLAQRWDESGVRVARLYNQS